MSGSFQRRTNWPGLAAWLVLLAACAYLLNTRHNQFAYFYHPDEPGKVEQVITGEWNFHHPMLLLSTSKLAAELAKAPKEKQPVVEVGRRVAAGFSAVAIAALALLAYLWRGWLVSFAAGGALLLHHQIYELSHYMKEDSALLMGVSLSFLAGYLYWHRAAWPYALFLGAACALATSGKYMGAMMLPLALFVLVRSPNAKPGRHIALWFGAFVAVMALVNAPLLSDFATFRDSFSREMDYVVHGQRGMTRSVPHAQYWNVFIDNTTPVMWALLLVFLIARWRERAVLRSLEWVMIVFPFAFALALSFSPKSNDRYFLVATAMFTLLAGAAVLDVARYFTRLRPYHTAVIAAVLLVLGQLPSWLRYEHAFQHDDTQELITWLNKQVSPAAVIVKDNRVLLPNPERKSDAERMGVIPQKVVVTPVRDPEAKRVRFAADVGTVAELQAAGITHVAISESDYGRFFLESLRPQEGGEDDYHRRRKFYEELRARKDDLVFERDRGTVIYLHPGIEVYEIAPRG